MASKGPQAYKVIRASKEQLVFKALLASKE
jgi:hypothetical protein